MEIWGKAAREDCPESEAGSAGSLGERNAGEKRIGNGVAIEKSRCPGRPAIVSKGVEFRRIVEIDACINKKSGTSGIGVADSRSEESLDGKRWDKRGRFGE